MTKLLFALSLLCSPGLLAQHTPPQRPNVVLIMADDQGWGDMAYTGHPVVQTPNFDTAAEAGLRFDGFYAAAPVCSPTRASVLTGRHPNRMGVFKWGYPMRPQETTLAEVLQEEGYATGHFGKWHLGSVRNGSPANPGECGFDHWVSAPNFYDNDPILSDRGKAVQFRGESSIVTADLAIAWMRKVAEKDAPFFAVIWFGSPHGPHRAAPEDLEMYRDQPQKVRNFLGEITGMDRAFGEVRSALGDMGIRDDTLLWYCSDNGALPVGSAGELRGKKGTLYEGGVRVPAFLEWPARIPDPQTCKLRCSTSDIFPTILGVAGVTPDPEAVLDGVSLTALLDGKPGTPPGRTGGGMGFWDHPARGISTPSAKWMKALLEAQTDGGDLPPDENSRLAANLPDPPEPTDSFPGHAAWIDGNWKLHRITGGDGTVRWELYDLARDPAEKNDLASKDADRVQAMDEALCAWLKSVANSLNGADYAR